MTGRGRRRTPSHPLLASAFSGVRAPSDGRASDAIEDVRELCLSLYHLAPIGYVTHRGDGRILEANYTLGSMLGVPSHQLRGAFLASFVEEGEECSLGTHLEQAAATRARVLVEVRMQRPTGTCFAAALETVPFDEGASGEVGERFLTAVLDITDRKRLEARLLEREETLRTIFAIAPDGLVGVDERGVIRAFGAGAERMFGYSTQEALGRHLSLLFEGAAALSGSERGSSVEGALVRRVRARRRDGASFEAEVSVGRSAGAGDTILVARAVSSGREDEERARLRETVGRVASSIVHDTNNLLMRVVSAAESLVDVADDPEAVRRRAEELRRITLGGAAVIRRLDGVMTPKAEPERTSDIDATLTNMSGLIGALLGEAIELSICLGAMGARVACDPGEFEQLVLNLVDNAGDALPRGGRVEIATSPVELDGREHVRLFVCDDGIGMTEEVRRRAFTRGFTNKLNGSGLGLDTVHGIVERARGRLRIESRPGAGTAFTIDLPALEPDVDEPSPRSGPSALLVVEDDPLNRRMLGTLLERRGYSVQLAASVREAIHEYQRAPQGIDVVLSDARLPDGTVSQLVSTLRSGASAPPVLVISGLDAAMDPEIASVLRMPRTAFMQKPAEIEGVVEEIESLRGRD